MKGEFSSWTIQLFKNQNQAQKQPKSEAVPLRV